MHIRLFDSFVNIKILIIIRTEREMGATCGSLNCNSKKHSKYPKPTIIKRPTNIDFSLDEDNE